MGVRTDDLLETLLYSAALVLRPTLSTIDRPELVWGPNWRPTRSLRHARTRGWLDTTETDGWHLTPTGRQRALRGRDPEPLWETEWDGQWRMVLFDLPESRRSLRAALRRKLIESGFGCLQRSVWITPHSFELAGFDASVPEHRAKQIVRIEARTASGMDPDDVVAAAWDWKAIDARYGAVQSALERLERSGDNPVALREALAAVREQWQAAAERDPFLPAELRPKTYRGQRVWQRRAEAMRQLATTGRLAAVFA